jgi:hypothetical protein
MSAPINLLEAVARQEEITDPHSRCSRNCNPGNMEWGRFAVAHGAIATDGRFAVFPDLQTGYAETNVLLG